ncbi:hypothetical protein UT300015_04580 [Clostridium tertium]
MFLGSFLWITLILSIALLFILIYKLISYLDKNIPTLINQFKEIKQLKKDLLTKYK